MFFTAPQDTDQWYSAVVLGRRDVAVPHTSIVLRTFEVSYVKIEGQDEEEEAPEDYYEEMSNELTTDEGIDPMISFDVAEPIFSTPGDLNTPPDIETMPPPPVEVTAPPPPPPPPPLFKLPLPQSKIPLKPVINANKNENGNENENEKEDEVITVKRVRKSRWDTVKPALIGSTGSGQTACIPPPPPPPHLLLPPPPLPPIGGILIKSITMESSAEGDVLEETSTDLAFNSGMSNDNENESSQRLSSITEGQINIETAEESDLVTPHEEIKEPDVQTIVISGVRSDHLRLLCNAAGELHGPSGDVVSTPSSRAGIVVPEVVESTGQCTVTHIHNAYAYAYGCGSLLNNDICDFN